MDGVSIPTIPSPPQGPQGSLEGRVWDSPSSGKAFTVDTLVVGFTSHHWKGTPQMARPSVIVDQSLRRFNIHMAATVSRH